MVCCRRIRAAWWKSGCIEKKEIHIEEYESWLWFLSLPGGVPAAGRLRLQRRQLRMALPAKDETPAPGVAVRLSFRCQLECLYASCMYVFPLPQPAIQITDTPWPLPSGGREESDGLRRKRKGRLGTDGESVHTPGLCTSDSRRGSGGSAARRHLVRSGRGRRTPLKLPGRDKPPSARHTSFGFLDS